MTDQYNNRQFKLLAANTQRNTELTVFLDGQQLYSGLVVESNDPSLGPFVLLGEVSVDDGIKSIHKARIVCHSGSLNVLTFAWNLGYKINPALSEQELYFIDNTVPMPIEIQNSISNKGGFYVYDDEIFMISESASDNRNMITKNGKLLNVDNLELIELVQGDVLEFDVLIFKRKHVFENQTLLGPLELSENNTN